MSPNARQPGPPAQARMIVVEATPTDTGSGVALTFACSTPGVVTNGGKDLVLAGITRPIFVFVRLVGVQGGLRFPPHPDDAVWFGHGTGKPGVPGTAGGRLVPKAVADDGDALLFLATKQGQGGTFAALFWFGTAVGAAVMSGITSGTTAAAASTALKSGGPIIIND